MSTSTTVSRFKYRSNGIVFSTAAATEVLDSMIAKSRVEWGVLLTGLPTNIFNKEVPVWILKTPQDTLDTQAQHVQLQPNVDFYSVVLESDLLGPTLQMEKKSECSESSTSGTLLSKQNMSSVRPVTHWNYKTETQCSENKAYCIPWHHWFKLSGATFYKHVAETRAQGHWTVSGCNLENNSG